MRTLHRIAILLLLASSVFASDVADSIGASGIKDVAMSKGNPSLNYGAQTNSYTGWSTTDTLRYWISGVDFSTYNSTYPTHQTDSCFLYMWCLLSDNNPTTFVFRMDGRFIFGTANGTYQGGSCSWISRGWGTAYDGSTITQNTGDTCWVSGNTGSTAGSINGIAGHSLISSYTATASAWIKIDITDIVQDSVDVAGKNYAVVLLADTIRNTAPGLNERVQYASVDYTTDATKKPYVKHYHSDSYPSYSNFLSDTSMKAAFLMRGPSCSIEKNMVDTTMILYPPSGVTENYLHRTNDRPATLAGVARKLGTYYLTLDNSTDLNINGANQSISISAWVKAFTSPASGDTEVVCGKSYGTGNNRQYRLSLVYTAAGQFKFCGTLSSDGTDRNNIVSTTARNDSTWYHCVFTSNDDSMKLYVNGALDCTPVAYTGGIASKAGYFTIGSQHLGVGVMTNAIVDEVAIFNRALRLSDIDSLYNNGITGDNGATDSPYFETFLSTTGFPIADDTLIYIAVSDSLAALCSTYGHIFENVWTSEEDRKLVSMTINPTGYGKTALIISGVHGDNGGGSEEYVSLVALEAAKYFAQNPPEHLRVIFVPLVNPDGTVASQRVNANGVNINRNYDVEWNLTTYDSGHWEYQGPSAFSEPETQAVRDAVLLYRPDFFLDIHGASDQIVSTREDTLYKTSANDYLTDNGLEPFVRTNYFVYADSGGYGFRWAYEVAGVGVDDSWGYETDDTYDDSTRIEEIQRLIGFLDIQFDRLDTLSDLTLPWFAGNPFNQLPFAVKPFNQ